MLHENLHHSKEIFNQSNESPVRTLTKRVTGGITEMRMTRKKAIDVKQENTIIEWIIIIIVIVISPRWRYRYLDP